MRIETMIADQQELMVSLFLIQSGKEGTCYFCSRRLIGSGVIKALKGRNLRIHEDLGVIGFVNMQFSEHITPTVSFVDHQTTQMAKSALILLLDLIDKREEPGQPVQKIVLEPLFIGRNSSDRCKL